MKKGSLVIVRTGINVGQLTMEARAYLESAHKVLYCVADPATERLILKLNSGAESLYCFYGEGKQRKETYEQMAERTLECVRAGQNVCVAYYGHPGVFVNPSHRAIKIAREEGHSARMLPAVSSIDCLICDVGFDPSSGCQIFEATDLMLRKRHVDPCSHVIILQVAALGDLAYSFKGYDYRNLPSLGEYLSSIYPPDFEVKAYEASQYPVCEPEIRDLKIEDLSKQGINEISTLYVPQLRNAPIHLSMLDKYDLTHIIDGLILVPLNTTPEMHLDLASS